MKFNFKIFCTMVLAIILPFIVFGEISPMLRNSGETILFYLGTFLNISVIYIEYVIIKKIILEVKNEKN